jgi:hypothetical protein
MRIGSASRWMQFERDPDRRERMFVQVASGQAAAKLCVSFLFSDFVGFLRSVAQDWKGWTGLRQFKTIDSDFVIIAAHNGVGEITFDVELKSQAERWKLLAKIPVEPGQLNIILAEAQEAFSGIPETEYPRT